jgi:hypothetical protein
MIADAYWCKVVMASQCHSLAFFGIPDAIMALDLRQQKFVRRGGNEQKGAGLLMAWDNVPLLRAPLW